MLTKNLKRQRRHQRIRSKISGTAAHPRLVVFRGNTHIYAQLVDDTVGHVLAASSTLKLKKGTGLEKARQVGEELAKKALEKSIKTCVFDRGGYLYHGRVKALAEGARAGGLQF